MQSNSSNKNMPDFKFLTGLAVSIIGVTISVIGLFPSSFKTSDVWMLLIFGMNTIIFCSALLVCFYPSPRYLNAIFALLFVLQLPQFVFAWSERFDDDTAIKYELGLGAPSSNEEAKTKLEKDLTQQVETERERSIQKDKEISKHERRVYESTLLLLGITHLYGLFGSLIGCIYAGHSR